ncbi:acetylxylan esterase A [Phyllosticta citribraziliensis]|uniref:Carboxylic ester hydrolase n=1 Tax=Phyllosticta citribraziliensis TaxID=989973 RepID=A0ABR1LPN1_9PEZI
MLVVRLFRSILATVFLFGVAVQAAALAKRGVQLQEVKDYGPNSAGVSMFVYVPPGVRQNPAVLVAIHWCQGSAQGYADGTPYQKLAQQKKNFIIVYPSSPHQGGCWDVSSPQTLRHEGGGDSTSIANQIKYATSKYRADKSKVYVVGSSSGAMMTNVLAATYPELISAATVYSGVPAGCFRSTSEKVDEWSQPCAKGEVTKTRSAWAAMVRAMDSGATSESKRPRMRIYHGADDAVLNPTNYREEIKQWCGVFGYDEDQPKQRKNGEPQQSWNTNVFGEKLEAVWADATGHTVPCRGDDDMKWFGLG